MKQILAVSGGVDSMVMLHMAAQQYPTSELVVVHFDHGIRENSSEDAEFVKHKAEQCGIEFQVGRAALGIQASEATAREARYSFLRQVATKHPGAKIWTAHHLNDLVESVTINLLRGTGWRGLAVLDTSDLHRPFLESEPWDRARIWRYAAEHNVSFRQDPTNNEDIYLRNRVRTQLAGRFGYEQKLELYSLWQRQRHLRTQIETADAEILPPKTEPWERSWFQTLEPEIALELLHIGTLRAGISATRPQLENFRQAIINYAPGKYFNLPEDHLVKLGKNKFEL